MYIEVTKPKKVERMTFSLKFEMEVEEITKTEGGKVLTKYKATIATHEVSGWNENKEVATNEALRRFFAEHAGLAECGKLRFVEPPPEKK